MSNFLAVDSGGTKTIAIIFDENAKILGVGKSDGGNAVLMDKISALSSVVEATTLAMEQCGKTAKQIKRGYLFIPGFKEVLSDYIEKMGIDVELKGEIDELHFSELKGGDGIVVLAGTGSFATAFVDEKNFRLGGWGTILGDEGSGYSIGLNAIKKAIIDFDDGINSKIVSVVKQFFSIDSIENLRSLIYKDSGMRAKIASLCKIVCENAQEGESDCDRILEVASDELAKMAMRVYIKSGSDKILPTHLSGGLKKAGKVFEDKFIKCLEKGGCGKLKYEKSGIEPVYGGMMCLLNDEGIDIKNIKIEG